MTQKVMIYEIFGCFMCFTLSVLSYREGRQTVDGLYCVSVFIIDLLVVLSVSGGLCWGLGYICIQINFNFNFDFC